MARAYVSTFKGISVSAVQDVFDLQTPNNMVCEIDEFAFGQISASTVGNLAFSAKRFTGAFSTGSGGASGTPRPTLSGDSAALTTIRTNDTVQTSGGTSVILPVDVVNVVNGYLYMPAREDRVALNISQAFIISLDTAPSPGETASGRLTHRETV